jgi:hypothetical protein
MNWLRPIVSALLAALYYWAVIAISNVLRIPAFVPQWDESDSNLRAAVLVLVGFPWFIALGAVLGRSKSLRLYSVRWIGALAGTALCLGLTAALSPALAGLSTRTLANVASVVLILSIPLVSTLGAWLAGRPTTRARRSASH